MTAEQKNSLGRFLDRAAASVSGGYLTVLREEEPAGEDAPGNIREPESLERIAADIRSCAACGLSETRKNAVPGEGVPHPLVVVIGEGPGFDEDNTGRPFVGRAGQLLDRMLDSKGQIGLYRNKNCFIANVVKCRPPGNRDPLPAEMSACGSFLTRQLALLAPRVILCVGKVAANRLLGSVVPETIGSLRGRFHSIEGIPMLATYHPSALLRNEALKKPAWDDMRLLREKLCELDGAYAKTVAKGM
ncbi:MAG: uracil-DNA glycosylase [Treponema sp.]|jgi:DNA polymerase|nr:uracil-DNA glycosylase [Treponema sp.]